MVFILPSSLTMHWKCKSISCSVVSNSVTPWTVAYQRERKKRETVCVCVCVCVCAGREAIWELIVPFDQFLCKPETSLKNKVHWLNILSWELVEDKTRWSGGEHSLICCAVLSRSVVSNSLQPHGLCVACQASLSMGLSRQEYWSW